VEILWPGGSTQTVQPQIDQLTTVTEQ